MKSAIVLVAALILAACTSTKQLVPTGGSRADGTVSLSYERGSLQSVEVDMEQGIRAARARCQAWGYQDASPFGGETRECQFRNEYGCMRYLITMNFQCLGGARPS